MSPYKSVTDVKKSHPLKWFGIYCTTSFGTSSYATKQVVDKIAVDTAVNTLRTIPGEKFVAITNLHEGYHQIGLSTPTEVTEYDR
jgi:hypothetical protein